MRVGGGGDVGVGVGNVKLWLVEVYPPSPHIFVHPEQVRGLINYWGWGGVPGLNESLFF